MLTPRRARPSVRHRWAVALVAAALPAGLVLSATPAAADDNATCAALTAPVYQRVDPDTQASTLSTQDTDDATFSQDNGAIMLAATQPAAGLVEVRELINPRNGNHVYIPAGTEASNAVSRYGMTDTGVAFYASPKALSCTDAVYRYRYKSYHRAVPESLNDGALAAAGWVLEGVTYHLPPTSTTPTPTPTPPQPPAGTGTPRPDRDPSDTTFSIAVMPDTQQEVWSPDQRFINRSNWLVANSVPSKLDLRFVTHTGDVVNWDTDTHDQYEWASKALQPLSDADIPWSLSIGNHDNEATGPGGGARDSKNTRTLFRDTATFNQYFTAADYGDVTGAFETGKVDNVYSEFYAGGKLWMVLNLEMWPRQAVVDWAKNVVAGHPSDNVIVVTHSYLNEDATISQSAGYGATSPQYLYDNLISRYANIKMVFSGHVGVAASRTDVGVNGNTVYSFLTAIHSNSTNPVRLVTIDTRSGTIDTSIVAPWNNATDWASYTQTITGVRWV